MSIGDPCAAAAIPPITTYRTPWSLRTDSARSGSKAGCSVDISALTMRSRAEQRPDIVGCDHRRAHSIARLHQQAVPDLPHVHSTHRQPLSTERFPTLAEQPRQCPESRVNGAHLDARHRRCGETCSLRKLPLREAGPAPRACEYASRLHAYTLARPRGSQSPSAVFAMISFITSSVPPPMRMSRESRKYREMPVSAM